MSDALAEAEYKIALILGDGIGPKVIDAAKEVLRAAQELCKFRLAYKLAPCGDSTKAETGEAVPESSVKTFLESHACLKGPVGETVMDVNRRFRFDFDLYANIRPAKSYPQITPPALRPDIDLVVIRENTEGFYKAIEDQVAPGLWLTSGLYSDKACKRIAKFSFEYAQKRLKSRGGKGKVAFAHKANVFRNSHGMFLSICKQTASIYPEIEFSSYYADAMCALLVRQPHTFDVILAENLIADLLSDLAGQVAGGLGMTAGTNINYERKLGYFEPTHGSAPDIAGSGKANPIGQIRSAALMLEFLGMAHGDGRCVRASEMIERAIEEYLTKLNKMSLPVELGGNASTSKVGEAIASKLLY